MARNSIQFTSYGDAGRFQDAVEGDLDNLDPNPEIDLQRTMTAEEYADYRNPEENPIGLQTTMTDEKKAQQFVVHKHWDAVCLYSILAFWGIVGCLIRIAITRLTSFNGSQYGGVLWCNFAGSLFMGLLVHNTHLFGGLLDEANERRRRLYQKKAEIPLYISLATGACGSITSFSSFILSLFELSTLQLTNSNLTYPNKGYGLAVFISYTIVTIGVSFAGYFAGGHFSKALEKTLIVSLAKFELALELTFAFLGIAFWIVVIVLSGVYPTWRYWTLSMVFGPIGVYMRFWLAKYCNPWIKSFPVGTFLANMIGVGLLSILVLLKNGKASDGSGNLLVDSYLDCQVLAALMDGLCGSLSTISSLVAELYAFRKLRHAYFYGMTSLVGGWCLIVLILGSYAWTHGLTLDSAC